MNYENMTNEEIKYQLEWSDSHEFSYGYSLWAFEEISRLNNIIKEIREKNRNLIEDNMRLRKELNLHGGKLYISDIEVKEVWK